MGELETRLNEANEMAVRGGRMAMAKLETRIRELEAELGCVQARSGETVKSFQKAERKGKEISFQNEEDKKNNDRMTDLASKLQAKIKTYKKQIEEPKRSRPSTWLSTARLSKSMRRLRRGLAWLKIKCQLSELHPYFRFKHQVLVPQLMTTFTRVIDHF